MAHFAQPKARGVKFINIGCMLINHRLDDATFVQWTANTRTSLVTLVNA
jgi:hypothetical protein